MFSHRYRKSLLGLGSRRNVKFGALSAAREPSPVPWQHPLIAQAQWVYWAEIFHLLFAV